MSDEPENIRKAVNECFDKYTKSIPGMLELATAAQLCEELLKRFPHLIIAGLTDRNDGDLTEIRYQQGNSRTCQGLALGVMFRIEHDLDERRVPDKDE